MQPIHQPNNPVNHLPFDFLFSGKTATLNKTISQKFSPQFAVALHELVWRADRSEGNAVISADELGNELSVSARAARNLLKNLKNSGIISSKRGAPVNIYQLNKDVSRETLGTSLDDDSDKSMPSFYYTGRHLTIPKWMIAEVGIVEAAVYSELVWFYRRLLVGKKIRPSVPFYQTFWNIGEELGLSEDQVYRAIKKLKSAKLLSVTRKGYSRKCYFSLSEERALEMQKTRQKSAENATVIDTFRGTITILNNTNKAKSSEIRTPLTVSEELPNNSSPFHHLSQSLNSSRNSDWEIRRAEPERYVPEAGDEEEIYVAAIPGIVLDGSRKYTVREHAILKIIGETFQKATGETFRFGAGIYDREDLLAVGKFSLGEIGKIAYNCSEAWRKKLPGFKKHLPHLRTISARLGTLTTESIADMEFRVERNREMRRIREMGKAKVAPAKRYFEGQYYAELMDPNSEWG